MVTPTQLRGIAGPDDAVALLADLGYNRPASPVDANQLGLPGLKQAWVIRSGAKKRQGYSVIVAEAAEERRSLRPLARALQLEVHDRPLAVLGFADEGGRWERMVVLRPRRTGGRLGTVTVARLDVDLRHPTMHDAEVLGLASWQPYRGDEAAQLLSTTHWTSSASPKPSTAAWSRTSVRWSAGSRRAALPTW